MTKRDEFIEEFKERENIHPGNLKDKPKKVAKILNKKENSDLRTLFREAVKEAAEDENNPAAGLNMLFS